MSKLMKIIFWYLQLLIDRKMFCLYKITIWNEFSFAIFWKHLVLISMICINTTLNILFKATITKLPNLSAYHYFWISRHNNDSWRTEATRRVQEVSTTTTNYLFVIFTLIVFVLTQKWLYVQKTNIKLVRNKNNKPS